MDSPDTSESTKENSVQNTQNEETQSVLTFINRPLERYAIQYTLVKRGVYLINPATYKYINGFLNAPAIYLTLTPPVPQNGERFSIGFLHQSSSHKVKDDQTPEELKIDATLYFSYPTDEYALGLDENGVFHAVIQTWHDAEVEKWDKIAHEVALELSTNEDGSINQTVKFYITSTFLPSDPDAPRQLIIKPRCQILHDAVSDMDLEAYEEDY